MAKLKVKDLEKMSEQSLRLEILAHQKALLNFRFQSKMDEKTVKPHMIRLSRKNIARMKMILGAKNISKLMKGN